MICCSSRLKHDEFNVIAAKIVTLFPKEALGTYYVEPIKKRDSLNGKSIPAKGKLVDKCRNILYKAGERITKRRVEEDFDCSKRIRSENGIFILKSILYSIMKSQNSYSRC